jgi:hypothetical protein
MFTDPARIEALAIHLQAENIRRARFHSRPVAAADETARTLAEVATPLKTIWGKPVTSSPCGKGSTQRLKSAQRHRKESQETGARGTRHLRHLPPGKFSVWRHRPLPAMMAARGAVWQALAGSFGDA